MCAFSAASTISSSNVALQGTPTTCGGQDDRPALHGMELGSARPARGGGKAPADVGEVFAEDAVRERVGPGRRGWCGGRRVGRLRSGSLWRCWVRTGTEQDMQGIAY